MSQPNGLEEWQERYDRAVTESKEAAALLVVEELLEGGADPVRVLTDVVGRQQRLVGERWKCGDWSVAQEHAATAIAMACAETVRRRVSRVPVSRGRIILACPEHEWHAVAAQILAGALRAHGWDVTLLGASTPAARLGRFLHELGPDAAGVSCSVLRSLSSARAFIEASTAAGIPVLAGGVAFGPDALRARTLGASGWAPDPVGAVEVLNSLPPVVAPVPPLPAGPVSEQSGLDMRHDALVSTLLADWVERRPGLDALGGTERDIVDHAMQAVQATLLTADERIMEGARSWACEVLAARDLPEDWLADLGQELARRLDQYPLAAALVAGHWPGA